MLACARIGAVHSVVFGAFSEDSLRDRIQDSECKILVTQDTALRGAKNDIPMKTKATRPSSSARASRRSSSSSAPATTCR
jgi:acetyl-CoA synthetase